MGLKSLLASIGSLLTSENLILVYAVVVGYLDRLSFNTVAIITVVLVLGFLRDKYIVKYHVVDTKDIQRQINEIQMQMGMKRIL